MAAAAATEADDGDDPTGFRRVILFVYLCFCVSVLALVLVLLGCFYSDKSCFDWQVVAFSLGIFSF